jgi:hypothetical protein
LHGNFYREEHQEGSIRLFKDILDVRIVRNEIKGSESHDQSIDDNEGDNSNLYVFIVDNFSTKESKFPYSSVILVFRFFGLVLVILITGITCLLGADRILVSFLAPSIISVT